MQVRDVGKYAKNIGTYFGASLIPMLLTLVINPWIAKNMSPDDYAITGYYNSFNSLLTPIITFCLIPYYIRQYFKLTEEEREKLFSTIGKALIWLSGISSLICCFGILVYIKWIATDFSLPVAPYLYLAVLALPFAGLMQLLLAKFRISRDTRSYFVLSVSNGVLGILLSLFLVVFIKWGAFGKLLATFCSNVLIFLVLLIKYGKNLRYKTDWRGYLKIFKFCLPLILASILGYFNNGFATTYLESIGNNTEYGIYVVGSTIGGYLFVFAQAIGSTFQPDIYETTIKKQWRRFGAFCVLQIGMIAAVVLIFIILAPFVIDILTAGRYVDSTIYARIVALNTLSSGIYYLVNNYSIATGRPGLFLYTTIVGSILIIIVMPWAVDRFQYIGACFVNVFSFLALAIINLCLLKFKKPNF